MPNAAPFVTVATAIELTVPVRSPLNIVALESWLAVAPNAAPDVTVATATLLTVPVKLPPKIVAVES